jgi:hypothetical protein
VLPILMTDERKGLRGQHGAFAKEDIEKDEFICGYPLVVKTETHAEGVLEACPDLVERFNSNGWSFNHMGLCGSVLGACPNFVGRYVNHFAVNVETAPFLNPERKNVAFIECYRRTESEHGVLLIPILLIFASKRILKGTELLSNYDRAYFHLSDESVGANGKKKRYVSR